MKAAYKPRDIAFGSQLVHLDVGEFVTGREALSREFNEGMKKSHRVNPLTLWRWLQVLEKHGNLNIKSNNKFSVVRVVNFAVYNPIEFPDEQQNEQLVNSSCTADEQLLNTNKKLRNKDIKNSRSKEDQKISFAEFVRMTENEHKQLIDNLGEERTNAYIERLDNYKGSTGKRYKSDYRTILTWVSKDDDNQSKGGNKRGDNRTSARGESDNELDAIERGFIQ